MENEKFLHSIFFLLLQTEKARRCKEKTKKKKKGNRKTKTTVETRVKCALEEELLESCRSFRFIVPIQGLISYREIFGFSLLFSLGCIMCGLWTIEVFSKIHSLRTRCFTKLLTTVIPFFICFSYTNVWGIKRFGASSCVPGIKMQCPNSSSNSSGGGLIDRKPSYFGHPAGSVTLSSLSSLSSLNLSNIGGLSISNIPGTVSSNIHHTTTTPSTTMYYDQIKYSMWNDLKQSATCYNL